MDLRSEAGRVEFSVEPADAVVYIDGRLVGSGEELAGQDQPLLVDPGSHVVEVSRPGYEDQKLEFTVESGSVESVTIKLKSGGS